MRGRQPIGYVVQIDGVEVTLNLLDMHRGHVASHATGTSTVTEVGSLLAVGVGSQVLVMKVSGLSFAEPREAHRFGVASSTHQSEPLRHLTGVVVGRLARANRGVEFVRDALSTPSLGAEVFPLDQQEFSSILNGEMIEHNAIHLGDDLRGGGPLKLGLGDLISRHVAVLGSSGQGKSSFTAAVLQQVVRLQGSRTVVFDINGEYEQALRLTGLPSDALKVTRIGSSEDGGLRLPYYALGRQGLQKLLMPSEKTQRPALNFALDSLNKVQWFDGEGGIGLESDRQATLFSDCRQEGAGVAKNRIDRLRGNGAGEVNEWPPMRALSPLIAESHALTPKGSGYERNAFLYGNVGPLITRLQQLLSDPMFRAIVDVEGGQPGEGLSWKDASTELVERVFGGGQAESWRVHVVDLKLVPHDLMPFILGALLELYAHVLFERGQEDKVPTLLVLEEAHHYLRPTTGADQEVGSSLAYERLAKEGRKFGLALWLSTQRPSEISDTVLSQCNNWVSFRLSSEKDLMAVQAASEWADRRELRRIPGLARQNAMVFGGGIQMPSLIKARTANPAPRSEDAPFDEWGSGE